MANRRPPSWKPGPGDYGRVFGEQNPWHTTGAVPDALACPVERPMGRQLWRRVLAREPSRYQLVLGPRRVGKTTCMYQTVRRLLREGIAPQRLWWLRMDHPLLMARPLQDLVRYAIRSWPQAPKEPLFLFLDELTYATDWDLWLKTFYDEHWPVRIVGTSSSTAALRHRRMESGVGRWEEQYLAPYLLTEYLDLAGLGIALAAEPALHRTLAAAIRKGVDLVGVEGHRRRFVLTGGFPELLVRMAEPGADEGRRLLQAQGVLRSDAVERALYKDIPQAFGVDNPMMLERLLYVLAGQITGVLSPQALCSELDGLSVPTFDRYLAYLERAFLVFTLPNFSGSERSVQRRGRKLYFVDGAVRNAALQRGLAPLDDPGEMGPLLENLAAAHLHALSQQSQVRLFHWREKKGEVDLVYNHPEEPLAFEVGSRPQHSRQGLRTFIERHPKFAGRCYVVAQGIPPLSPEDSEDGIGSLPLDLFLVAVGRQAEAEMARRLEA
jgi:predicted AAA+ superfamily ATPase